VLFGPEKMPKYDVLQKENYEKQTCVLGNN